MARHLSLRTPRFALSAADLSLSIGHNLLIWAAMRADGILENGDVEGYTAWKRVLKALEKLVRVERKERERVN